MRHQIQESGLLGKVITAIVGAVLLVVGFMFSLVVLAVVVVLGLGVWGWFWWKTRKLRQHLRENPPQPYERQNGHVIEGEAVIVEEEVIRATANRLPESPDRH